MNTGTNPRINHQIQALEIRVLSETGENLGVLTKEKALELAIGKGLDLIEISPSAKPPVAKIMSFDKFRFEYEKKRKQERIQAKSKGDELKQIQISVREARHDLEIKLKRIEEFLTDGHPVTVALVLRGREKANKDFARRKLDDFLKMIKVEFQTAMEPRWGMRGLNVQIVKR